MRDVVPVISDHRFGLVGVVDDGQRLLGVISDGDLRRHFHKLSEATAGDVMTRQPRSLYGDMVAVDALRFMNEAQITAAFVVDPLDKAGAIPIGIVHMHDLLRMGLAQGGGRRVTRFAIVIPARYESTRYPGKPLAMLRGADGRARPLIERSWRAAMTVRAPGLIGVWVATDDARIANVARDFGAQVVMTTSDCRNGTERCAQAMGQLPPVDVVVNLQGMRL
jgi:hypothetical protein